MADDRTAVLSEAYDKLAAEPAPEAPPAEAAPEPVAETASSTTTPDTPAPEAKPERPRDESGRFLPADKAPKADTKSETKPPEPGKTTVTAAPVPGAATPTAEPVTPPVQTSTVKAPQSWTPQAREAFSKAPPEVQAEVTRREREIAVALHQTTEARRIAETAQRTFAPYEGLARAAGAPDAITYAGSVLQTAAALQMGAPTQRAQVIATLINSYGVDLDAINTALRDGPQQAQPAAPAKPPADPRQEYRRILEEERAEMELREFVQSQPEFLDLDLPYEQRNPTAQRLWSVMTGLVSSGAARDMKSAYTMALRADDETSSVLSQRRAAEEAKKRADEMARQKVAASSVRSTPATPVVQEATDRRAVLSRAYDELNR